LNSSVAEIFRMRPFFLRVKPDFAGYSSLSFIRLSWDRMTVGYTCN